MLLIAMIREFMLLDVGIFPDGSEPLHRDDKQRADIPLLLARAVVNMYEHDWALAETCTLWTGDSRMKRRWYRLARDEPIYETKRVLVMGAGVYVTDEGIVLLTTYRGSPSGRVSSGPVRVVGQPSRINDWALNSLHGGLRRAADYAPVHI